MVSSSGSEDSLVYEGRLVRIINSHPWPNGPSFELPRDQSYHRSCLAVRARQTKSSGKHLAASKMLHAVTQAAGPPKPGPNRGHISSPSMSMESCYPQIRTSSGSAWMWAFAGGCSIQGLGLGGALVMGPAR